MDQALKSTRGYWKQPIQKIRTDLLRLRMISNTGFMSNIYIKLTREGHIVVDTGWFYTTDQWIHAMEEHGLHFDDIRWILYTHTHEDHMSGGVSLKNRWTGEHVVWHGTRPALENYYAYYRELSNWKARVLEEVPKSKASQTLNLYLEESERLSMPTMLSVRPEKIRTVSFGETLKLGDLHWTCLDGRGHDPHHVGWYVEEEGWLFGGDNILPVRTPILSPQGHELSQYRSTLERWMKLDVNLLFPGHGPVQRHFYKAISYSYRELQNLKALTQAALDRYEYLDPSQVALDYIGSDDAHARPKLFVMTCNILAQLKEFEALDMAQMREDHYWKKFSKH